MIFPLSVRSTEHCTNSSQGWKFPCSSCHSIGFEGAITRTGITGRQRPGEFYISSVNGISSSKQLLRPLLRNKAILLPLSLPMLVTAAVSPSFILLFTAEIWDVGMNMPNSVAILFAVLSIMGASFYLVTIQSLFLPRKEKRILTEHLAVANTTLYLSIFLSCISLFLMNGLLMLFMELYVFPSDLIQTWPTLNKQAVELSDLIRLAAFISTVGVTTGALAGGFESRAVIRQLSLFERQK